jgi:hypothetical protein
LITQREKARALRSGFEVDNEETRVALSARLFGIPKGADPASVFIHRDASDRAAKIDKIDDAAATLKRALEHGDTVLAPAVASHAHGKRWDPVVASYAENTGQSGDLETLNDIPSGGLSKLAVNTLFWFARHKRCKPSAATAPTAHWSSIAAGEE